MALFGRAKPRRRHNRRPTNPWLREVTQNESSRKLVEGLQETNPIIQAAIVQQMTHVDIKPDQIRIATPEEAFEAAVTREALKDIANDPETIADAKAAMLDRMHKIAPGGRRRQRGSGDGEYEGMPYGGFDPTDPIAMVEKVEELKERLHGGGAWSKLADSTVLMKLIETLVPALLGKPALSAGPDIVSVEIDGQLVEMTRAGYMIYKRQQEQLRLQSGSIGISAPAKVEPASTTAPPPTIATATGISKPEVKPIEMPETVRKAIATIAQRFVDNMALPPETFAHNFYEEAQTDEGVAVIFSMMRETTYDEAVARLQGLKHYPDLLPFINKLEANREWATAVIAKVKELAEEEKE